MKPRAIVIVCDSLGVGELPDAADFGDVGSNTLGHVLDSQHPSLPTLTRPWVDHGPFRFSRADALMNGCALVAGVGTGVLVAKSLVRSRLREPHSVRQRP